MLSRGKQRAKPNPCLRGALWGIGVRLQNWQRWAASFSMHLLHIHLSLVCSVVFFEKSLWSVLFLWPWKWSRPALWTRMALTRTIQPWRMLRGIIGTWTKGTKGTQETVVPVLDFRCWDKFSGLSQCVCIISVSVGQQSNWFNCTSRYQPDVLSPGTRVICTSKLIQAAGGIPVCVREPVPVALLAVDQGWLPSESWLRPLSDGSPLTRQVSLTSFLQPAAEHCLLLTSSCELH